MSLLVQQHAFPWAELINGRGLILITVVEYKGIVCENGIHVVEFPEDMHHLTATQAQ